MLISRLKCTYAAALWDVMENYIGCMIGGFLDETASEKDEVCTATHALNNPLLQAVITWAA